MYEVTSIPFVRRTRATLRSAEFGFLGVVVYTRVQTPRFCGDSLSAGAFFFTESFSRPLRTSWLIVGIVSVLVRLSNKNAPGCQGDSRSSVAPSAAETADRLALPSAALTLPRREGAF